MSNVTDVLIYVDYIMVEEGGDLRDALSGPIPGEVQATLHRIDMAAAQNWKRFSSEVWAAAFNYLNVEAFRDWARGLPWDETEALLIVSTEDDWTVERLGGATPLIHLAPYGDTAVTCCWTDLNALPADALMTSDKSRVTCPAMKESPPPALLRPACHHCGRQRLAGERIDYRPEQLIKGERVGWHVSREGDACPECLHRLLLGGVSVDQLP